MPSGANLRNVWKIATQGVSEAHFATFPEKLVQPCILAGTSAKGCCPECGAPTGWTPKLRPHIRPHSLHRPGPLLRIRDHCQGCHSIQPAWDRLRPGLSRHRKETNRRYPKEIDMKESAGD